MSEWREAGKGRRVVILAGGEAEPAAFVRAQVKENDLLIAANGGSLLAQRAGLAPHLLVGDLDSLGAVEPPAETVVVRFPAEKDESDLELALDHALEHEPSEIVVVGALGGRLDHLLINVSLLHRARERGTPMRLVGSQAEAFLVCGACVLERPAGSIVSLVPQTPTAAGVRLEGFRYGLRGDTLKLGTSRGLSNVIDHPPARISVESGILLVVVCGAAVSSL
jgi:thiamine pyrophosphokinase